VNKKTGESSRLIIPDPHRKWFCKKGHKWQGYSWGFTFVPGYDETFEIKTGPLCQACVVQFLQSNFSAFTI